MRHVRVAVPLVRCVRRLMAPPANHRRPLRLAPLARGLPNDRRNLLAVDALERILEKQATLVPFQDVYRAGYNLCLARQHDALRDQYELAVRRSAAFRTNARASRAACLRPQPLPERTAVFSRGVTVLHMGTHALPWRLGTHQSNPRNDMPRRIGAPGTRHVRVAIAQHRHEDQQNNDDGHRLNDDGPLAADQPAHRAPRNRSPSRDESEATKRTSFRRSRLCARRGADQGWCAGEDAR